MYYTQTKEAIQLENLLSVVPIEEDLVFEEYYKEDDGDTEDSNSESNWRNDYPDSEESENSIGEDDIRNAMENLTVGDDYEDEDHNYDYDDDYDDDPSHSDFVYGLNQDDVERYGWRYAQYKAKILKEMEDVDESVEDYDSDMDDFASSDPSSDCSVNAIEE